MGKHRDSKGRALRSGESQRENGQYMYRYTDCDGNRRTVYSWRLVASDRTPAGKKDSEALRELEKKIQKDLDDRIHIAADSVQEYALITHPLQTAHHRTRIIGAHPR